MFPTVHGTRGVTTLLKRTVGAPGPAGPDIVFVVGVRTLRLTLGPVSYVLVRLTLKLLPSMRWTLLEAVTELLQTKEQLWTVTAPVFLWMSDRGTTHSCLALYAPTLRLVFASLTLMLPKQATLRPLMLLTTSASLPFSTLWGSLTAWCT